MQAHSGSFEAAVGTIGGTLLATLSNIHSEDVVKTVVLSLIGLIVSLVGSLAFKWAVKRLRRK
jgi:hypothetical protein